MKALVTDPFKDDVAGFLEWAYGTNARVIFSNAVIYDDQRVGQSFMNVLRIFDEPEYIRLTGTDVDPFYVDKKIPAALDRLTSK